MASVKNTPLTPYQHKYNYVAYHMMITMDKIVF